MINIRFTYFDSELPEDSWKSHLCKLPQDIQNKINRYIRWEDRHRGLFGKLLLLEELGQYGYASDCLERLSYNDFGKPFLDSRINFNISHSGGYIACAVSDKEKIGIDIEAVRHINLSDFKRYMNAGEWRIIRASGTQYEEFYKYWTKKESVMKADGRGFSIPLTDIRLGETNAVLYETRWFLREISVRSGYRCHLAADSEDARVRIAETRFF